MVSASKILTVSYGTFSCTLEGFDDPFSTMRSIAEYFRDLAADDRYFGAEPPTPDAEMLHRIAERELRRPVEARIEDNNVILRQSEETAAEDVAPGAEMVIDETALEVEAAAPTQNETKDADAQGAEAPAKPKRTKAQRKAARQAKQAKKNRKQRQAAKEARRQAEKAAQTQAAQAKTAPSKAAGVAVSEIATDDAGQKPGSEPAEPQDAHADTPADLGQSQGTDLSDASIAAKLMRIRAVVENDQPESDNDPLDGTQSDDFYASIRDEAAEEAGLLDADLREGVLKKPAQEDVETDSQLKAETETDDGLLARIADATDGIEETPQSLEQEAASDQGNDDDDDFLGKNAFSDAPEDEEKPRQGARRDTPVAIARVMKVRKTQPGQSRPQKAPENHGRTNDASKSEGPATPTPESSLSDEDEAALMAELAEVERETSKNAPADGTNNASPQARTAFDDGDIAGADAIERILAETDAKLMSDEANQRRASIAHLRAAVQAKRAEGDNSTDDAESQQDTYREDLVEVVRPRRPARGEKAARRLAPLVLVSEQRIDSKDAPEAPGKAPAAKVAVRPRRVHVKTEAAAGESTQTPVQAFSAFLVEKDASSAEELLEAAAAFRIFVGGQETFSRPQVMGLVLKAEHAGKFTREDGLRAFGKLIRDGVIRKIQRGRYTISENTRFRPDPARASA